MSGRAPGKTTGKSIKILNPDGSNWNKIPFMDRAAGCGGAMRAACIGLVFDDVGKVIEVAVEAGRITHHNPIGYLGSVVAAVFTYYAIRRVEPLSWAARLFEEVFPRAREYVKRSGRELQLNFGPQWEYF
jgi:ADP-ribosylarginine hydrolase